MDGLRQEAFAFGSNARWCKACKAVFTGDKCPGGHANFQYSKSIPPGATLHTALEAEADQHDGDGLEAEAEGRAATEAAKKQLTAEENAPTAAAELERMTAEEATAVGSGRLSFDSTLLRVDCAAVCR